VTAAAEPTAQGEQLLDPFHVCGRVKRIRNKPVQSFCGSDTFLRIAQAEREGLIEVRVGVGGRPTICVMSYTGSEHASARGPLRSSCALLEDMASWAMTEEEEALCRWMRRHSRRTSPSK
jgi:hypothetical protein